MSSLVEFSLAIFLLSSSFYILYRLDDRSRKKNASYNDKTGVYKWSPKARRRVYDLHAGGYSVRQITKVTSIPKSTVHEIIHEQKKLNND